MHNSGINEHVNTLLTLSNINCRYGDKTIVENLSFDLADGEIACLLGPSGCGKTTVLRAIAGFEDIHAGSITLDGNCLSRLNNTVPPEHRKIGMVFQDYALFPHISVQKNIAFGLHKLPKPERKYKVDKLLALIKLDSHADAYPHQLSGGQQQRVALARALATEPKLLLMDEPFSNLDTELRRELSIEVRKILKKSNISAILVTHDKTEALTMADQIGQMKSGNLDRWDSSAEFSNNSQFIHSLST